MKRISFICSVRAKEMSENTDNNNQAVPPAASPSKTSFVHRPRMSSQPAFFTSLRARPIVHHTQHVDDLGRKNSIDIKSRRDLRFDECSLQMMSDPNSVIYRRLSETLGVGKPAATRLTEEEDKLKLFEPYGPKLVEFVKDKDGNLKSKFDKVFII